VNREQKIMIRRSVKKNFDNIRNFDIDTDPKFIPTKSKRGEEWCCCSLKFDVNYTYDLGCDQGYRSRRSESFKL